MAPSKIQRGTPAYRRITIAMLLAGLVNGLVGGFAGSIGGQLARSDVLSRWLGRVSAGIFGLLLLIFGERFRRAIQETRHGKQRLTVVGWIVVAIGSLDPVMGGVDR